MSRFTSLALALAAPLMLAACGEGGQETAEQQPPAETEAARPAEQQPPAETETARRTEPAPAQTAQQQAPDAAEAPAGAEQPEGEIVVVPPADQAGAPAGPQTSQPPGDRSPEAAGAPGVAAYVGRWAEDPEMCQQSFWTFTNLRLQSPETLVCDIVATEEGEDGLDLQAACVDRGQPLAEPSRDTITLAFPDMPQTDTMAVSGGPLDEEITLSRCPLG